MIVWHSETHTHTQPELTIVYISWLQLHIMSLNITLYYTVTSAYAIKTQFLTNYILFIYVTSIANCS